MKIVIQPEYDLCLSCTFRVLSVVCTDVQRRASRALGGHSRRPQQTPCSRVLTEPSKLGAQCEYLSTL